MKFVFDHEGELAARLKVKPIITVKDFDSAINTGWVIYDPSFAWPGQLPRAFDFFCDFVFHASQRLPGRKLFACDELQKLVGPNNVSEYLTAVLETGRRYCLDAVMIAQQPNLIHNRIRNQITEVVTFQQMDPQALVFLKAAGFDEDAVRALRPGQFIAANLQTGRKERGALF